MMNKVLLLLLIASPAWAFPERVNLCTGTTCTDAGIIQYGRDVRVGVAVDDDAGCPTTATYSIQGQNTYTDYTGVNYFEIMTISTASWGMQFFDPAIYFPIVRAVPSFTLPGGCSSLEVNLWIEKQ